MNTFVSVTCAGCGNEFNKALGSYNKSIKRGDKQHFCCYKCIGTFYSLRQLVSCKFCGLQFEKKLDQIKKTKNHFCSKSCSAKYNNKLFPKREKQQYYCKKCSQPCQSRRVYCSICFRETFNDPTKTTIEDLIGKEQQSRHSVVRAYARMVTAQREKKCVNCGYDKHVETCHIKGVKEFPFSTLLSEVNHPNNLILLCRNCHWEFDHGLLEHIRKISVTGLEPVTSNI